MSMSAPRDSARASGRHSTRSSRRRGLAATAILCPLYSWNDFFFALILTRTEAMTAPVAVVNFMNYEGWEWGKIAAGGTMVMLPVLFFSILVRKFLVHGLTAGALKG
jgi:multiple sugar transport system permease protein